MREATQDDEHWNMGDDRTIRNRSVRHSSPRHDPIGGIARQNGIDPAIEAGVDEGMDAAFWVAQQQAHLSIGTRLVAVAQLLELPLICSKIHVGRREMLVRPERSDSRPFAVPAASRYGTALVRRLSDHHGEPHRPAPARNRWVVASGQLSDDTPSAGQPTADAAVDSPAGAPVIVRSRVRSTRPWKCSDLASACGLWRGFALDAVLGPQAFLRPWPREFRYAQLG